MGMLRHRGILVNGWNESAVRLAHEAVLEVYQIYVARYPESERHERCVTAVYPHPINGGAFFAVVPDGSKVGWQPSAVGELLRAQAVEALERVCRDYSGVGWCSVEMGGDNDRWEVTASSSRAEG